LRGMMRLVIMAWHVGWVAARRPSTGMQMLGVMETTATQVVWCACGVHAHRAVLMADNEGPRRRLIDP
jgi:hypothetical protein